MLATASTYNNGTLCFSLSSPNFLIGFNVPEGVSQWTAVIIFGLIALIRALIKLFRPGNDLPQIEEN